MQVASAARRGRPKDARAASYRLRRRAKVQRALKAALRLCDTTAETSHEKACQLLEAALHVRVSDLLVYDESGEVAIGLRARETLSPAEELRIVRYQSKVHASSKGKRGGIRWVAVELVSPLEILDRLAKLRGWTPDAPAFQLLFAQVQAPAVERGGASASLALVHDLAADLLEGPELDSYLIAHASGDAPTMTALLREAAARLRRVHDSITISAEASVNVEALLR